MSTPRRPFDPTALIEPIDRQAVRAYTRSRGGIWTPANVFGAIVGGVIVVMLLFIGIPLIVAGLFSGQNGSSGAPWGFLFFFAMIAVVILFAVRSVLGAGARAYRLDGFARANGMTYTPRIDDPARPGLIFGIGRDRFAGDVVRSPGPRVTEFANYRYTTGSGKNRTTHEWGYVAMRLETPLPNIVLDATGNNSFFGSNLPASFQRTQRLHLEGDFDEHFALYCPTGYERDALYLFTPDIMARFVDHAAQLDAEIVDDWLFLYSRRELSTLDPDTWAWLFSIVGALENKFAQWARWRDDRLAEAPPAPRYGSSAADYAAAQPGVDAAPAPVPFVPASAALRPPPGVAPQGRRLKRGVPWGALIAVVAFAAFWLLSQAGAWRSLFGG